MGMEQAIKAADRIDDADAREAFEQVAGWLKDQGEKTKFVPFEKPFRPNIPATWDALFTANSAIEREVTWIIDGWLIDDIVPHYGQAKVGKSTGIAGQIACIASIDTATGKRAKHWCGHQINRHGRILYYTGEETTGDVNARLRRTFKKMGYRGADLDLVMKRILPICPKSMTKQQFPGLNPFICAKMPIGNLRHEEYQATAALEWVYDIIDAENAAVSARGGAPDEMVIGIVFDSTTSVAGFSSTDEEGISNLLFELARSGQDRGLFTILVAHSPQGAKVLADNPDFQAVYRLKGNGAWTAICRLFIEWRLPAAKVKGGWYEAKRLFDQEIVSAKDELVVCVVGDGNGGFSKQKMWFKRDGEGGHVDLSRFMTHEPRGFTADDWQAIQDREAAEKAASGVAAAPSSTKVDREPARDVVLAMVKQAMKDNEAIATENDEALGKPVTGKQIIAMFKIWKRNKAAVERYPVLAREPKNGGVSEAEGGDFTIRYWIGRLVDDGSIAKVTGGYIPADRLEKGYRLRNAEPVEQDAAPAAHVVLDIASVSDAVLAVVTVMDEAFEAASSDGDEERQVPVTAKNVQLALRATVHQANHPVLREAYADGRLIFNGPATKQPIVQSAEWYCDELIASGKLQRLRDGTYALPVEDERKAA